MTEAREARGLGRPQFAELLNVTRQAVSQWEKNLRSPNAEMMEKAASCLRFPIHRFTRSIVEKPIGGTFFRSLAAATKIARTRALRRLDWVRYDICGYLRDFVEFPLVNFPELAVPQDPEDLSFENIEDIAQQTRQHWGLGDGPISDVVLLLENHGAVIVCQELGAPTLDAFSEWDSSTNTPYIVLGTDKQSAVRWRFNAAHELGHMLLHRDLRPNRIRQKDTLDLIEDQANYFAGAFLMPATSFGAALVRPSIQSFVAVKTQWRVSIAAMICRASNLGIISDTDESRLHTYRSQRGWSRMEPYDDELEPEHPRFIERAFDLMLNEGLTSKAGIESATAMYTSDIESSVGLEPGYLGDDVKHYKFPQVLKHETYPSQPDKYTMRLPFP